ncbi:MAG: hypothetical protein IKA37_00180 [Spirochaetales bacterium]|nr:hypothetical protein [Spirochaetales bacterium]MBR2316365.1 hypothetical protein [Spirochaetales bacterium]
MKKKPDYMPPKEIVVNGEIIKMHSSREERLRMAPVSSPRKNASIFAAENRSRLVLMIVLIVITMLGGLVSSYFMKNKECTLDGIKVTMTRKNYDMGHLQTFRVQLQNRTENVLQLKENYVLTFKLVNKNPDVDFPPKEKEVIVTKLKYAPYEAFSENIHFSDIPDGSYIATWTIPTQEDFTFSFNVGRKRK